MRQAKLTKWGNSIGIRIPAEIIEDANMYIGERLTIKIISKDKIVLAPAKDPQEGWLEAFNALADSGENKELIGDLENDFDRDEWVW